MTTAFRNPDRFAQGFEGSVRAAPGPRPRAPAIAALEGLGVLLLCVLALGQVAGPARAGRATSVVVISLDGTRPADLRPEDCPTLVSLAESGARARALEPVFPTNTFPNHVSLMTGVAPERHGIVNNHFVDPQRGDFDRDRIPSFIEVEPVWSWLAGRGVVSASYYWVGSEGPWRTGRGPRHWLPFDGSTSADTKVEQILAWLDLEDPAERPRLVTSWFHGADRAGHRHGPGSQAVRRDLRSQDRAIGELVRGLDERGLRASTALVFVSDHGMAPLGREVDLRQALKKAGVKGRVHGAGGFAQIDLDEPGRDLARSVEIARGLGLEAHARKSAPREWRVANPRFGDVVVLAPPDVTIESGRRLALPTRGWHGYRPDVASMAGIFIAVGPGIEAGVELGRVSNLDVAPTVLALLGERPPEWMEGRVIAEVAGGASEAGPMTREGVETQ
ncbi:MAG: ectonucleotide pyrophosphatase/phosphodiesterase [Myxococcota bacterium]